MKKEYTLRVKSLPCAKEKYFLIAMELLRKLRNKGIFCVFAGGMPRDSLLGIIPKDYDIIVGCGRKKLVSLFEKIIPVGEKFGLVKILFKCKIFDITVLSGRTIEDDAKRRDLTINSMYYDPFSEKIIDFTGGMEDLLSKKLKSPGNPEKLILDDPMRIMRTLRLSVQLGFDIDNLLKKAIEKYIFELDNVSPERIRDEFIMALSHENADILIKWNESEVFSSRHWKIIRSDIAFLIKKFIKTDIHVILALFLLKHNEDDVKDFLSGLRFSGKIREMVFFLYRNYKYIKKMGKDVSYNDIHLFKHPYFRSLEKLIDICGDEKMKIILENKKNIVSSAKIIELNGKDLISAGIKPGPIFNEIISEIRELSLKGQIKNRQEALRYIRRKYLDLNVCRLLKNF